MESRLNPWSSSPDTAIEEELEEFGIENIEPVCRSLSEIPYFIRRGIVIGHRDYRQIVRAMREKRPFYVMTGFMPSGRPHLGHLLVMKEVVWHIEQGGTGSIAIADREAHAVRGISWERCREFGREYLSCLYALGYEGATYFQSDNHRLKDLAFEAAGKINLSELSAIYGFGPETSLAHVMSVATQVADILYPQFAGQVAPTVVPVGLDQDPHIRLTRDVAHRLRMFTVEDRGDHISIRSKSAPESAMDAIYEAFPGSRRYGGHIDVPGGDYEMVAARARAVERACGGMAFITPSATYHRFMPGLQGGKMSSSLPESTFTFTESDEEIKKRVMGALTGGRVSLKEQRKLGGEPDRCSVFALNRFHMVEDDRELEEIRRRCMAGELMCGECKKATLERVLAFLADFRERMDEVAHLVEV
ncbi:MAG: tryptophan--tRNA ligase [Methanoculleaceae archaeon]